jgi:sulfonate transport system permease protein
LVAIAGYDAVNAPVRIEALPAGSRRTAILRPSPRKSLDTLLDKGWVSFVSPALLLFVWWWTTRAGIFSEQILVPPGQVMAAFNELVRSGELQANLGISMYRLFLGFGAGAVLGIAFGVLIALSPAAESFTAPLFQVLRQLPTVALIPMFILIFGVGESFKILIVMKATFFVIALATYDGIRNIPSAYFDVGRLYRLSPWGRFRNILFPAIVPALLTGVRIGLSRSWLILVGAELLAAESGIGQMMEMSRQIFRMDIVMVGVILTGVIGFALDRGLRLLERWLVRWQRA